MAKRTVTLRNAGPNDDSAEDLYTDALGMLNAILTRCADQPDTVDPEQLAKDLGDAFTILNVDLEIVS